MNSSVITFDMGQLGQRDLVCDYAVHRPFPQIRHPIDRADPGEPGGVELCRVAVQLDGRMLDITHELTETSFEAIAEQLAGEIL